MPNSTSTLLNLKDFIPIVPLRGTMSASGDLLPSANIVAAMKNMKDPDSCITELK